MADELAAVDRAVEAGDARGVTVSADRLQRLLDANGVKARVVVVEAHDEEVSDCSCCDGDDDIEFELLDLDDPEAVAEDRSKRHVAALEQSVVRSSRQLHEERLRDAFAMRAPEDPHWSFEVPMETPEPARVEAANGFESSESWARRELWLESRNRRRAAMWPWVWADAVLAQRGWPKALALLAFVFLGCFAKAQVQFGPCEMPGTGPACQTFAQLPSVSMVTLTSRMLVRVSTRMENTAPFAQDCRVDAHVWPAYQVAGGLWQFGNNVLLRDTRSFGAFDGSIDFDGPSGSWGGYVFLNVYKWTLATPAELAPFIGTGTVEVCYQPIETHYAVTNNTASLGRVFLSGSLQLAEVTP